MKAQIKNDLQVSNWQMDILKGSGNLFQISVYFNFLIL
jgi:hypothetical protein